MKAKQKIVLLVDDYKDVRDLYADFLTMNGLEVGVAGSGREALNKVLERAPDVIVMDYSLPDVGGWGVTQRLKKDPKTRHIPILLLTAYDFAGVTPVFKEHCAAILTKPCRPEHLLAEIMRALREADRLLKAEAESDG